MRVHAIDCDMDEDCTCEEGEGVSEDRSQTGMGKWYDGFVEGNINAMKYILRNHRDPLIMAELRKRIENWELRLKWAEQEKAIRAVKKSP